MNSNKFCDDVPTQVQALSSGVNYWRVTTGNDFGTVCGLDSRFPTAGTTGAMIMDYNQQGLTGTIPTEVSSCRAVKAFPTQSCCNNICLTLLSAPPSSGS